MMHNYLLDIAQNGLKGKKRGSTYLFLVCFLSVIFAVVNVSITGSLNKTRQEQRYCMYGEWKIAVYGQKPLTTALEDERIRGCGTAQIHGYLLDTGETVLTGVGAVDDSLRTLGCLEVMSGKFPTEDNEIAMEADVLSSLGYDYELGQSLALRIRDRDGEVVTREYILCGVLREYTDLWYTGKDTVALAGACVTEDAAKEIGRVCSYQYYLSTEKEGSHDLYLQLREEYVNTEAENPLARGLVVENIHAYGAAAREEYHYFNLALILMATIAAVIAVYSIQLKEQRRSIHLFRTIGATKKQLSALVFYETVLIAALAAALGIAVGSLATWGILRVLMEKDTGGFYISIPVVLIAGLLMLWLGAVFGVRFLALRYAIRGRLMGHGRLDSWAGRQNRGRNRLGLLFLSSVIVLVSIFCYMESLVNISIDQTWSQLSSYNIQSTEEALITDAYIESIEALPGIEEVIARHQVSGTLEFPGMEENPFSSLLMGHLYGAQPWDVFPDEEGEIKTPGPDGLWCRAYGVAEGNWDRYFGYVEEEIDRERFRNGETVLLYIPYNHRAGVELDGKLYQDFGVALGDVITVTNYGMGKAEAEVAGIITADLWMDPYLMVPSNDYYSVIAANEFVKKLTKTEGDDTLFWDGSWSYREYGYTYASVHTGLEAEYLSTDYLMAKWAADRRLGFTNSRVENGAYRQEARQALLHIWVCGIGIFLILLLVQLNIEMLLGLSRRRSFALLRVIGMSKGRLRMGLAAKGLLVSLAACLLGHVGFVLYFMIKHMGTYRRFVDELEYTGTFVQVLKGQVESYLRSGWSLPGHLAFCAFGMACVFLLFFCPQNRVLKENIRER